MPISFSCLNTIIGYEWLFYSYQYLMLDSLTSTRKSYLISWADAHNWSSCPVQAIIPYLSFHIMYKSFLIFLFVVSPERNSWCSYCSSSWIILFHTQMLVWWTVVSVVQICVLLTCRFSLIKYCITQFHRPIIYFLFLVNVQYMYNH